MKKFLAVAVRRVFFGIACSRPEKGNGLPAARAPVQP